MAKTKRPCLSVAEQQILEHLQVRVVSTPEDTARLDQLIVDLRWTPKIGPVAKL